MTGNEALLTFALIAGGFLLGGVMFSRALPKLLTGKDVCALRTLFPYTTLFRSDRKSIV